MQNIFGTIFMAATLILVSACSGSDGVDLFGDDGGAAGAGGAGGGGGGGTGGGGSQTYSVSVLGAEVQKKGSTDTVVLTGLPINGPTITGP